MNEVPAHDDAIKQDLARRESGHDLVEEGRDLAKDLRAYTRAAWHVIRPDDKFIDNWHIGAMAEVLTAVSAGEIRYLAINVPPGSMKTLSGSIFWPTWVWTWNPGWRLMSGTYDFEMQVELGMLPSRDLIQSDWYQDRWGHVFNLRSDLNKRSVYANNRGGARYAVAPNAKKVIGRHVHCILLDDPNDVEAEGASAIELDNVIEWHDGKLGTRYAEPEKGAMVIIQQRVHEKDLTGHVLDGKWHVLCLPERFNAKHPHAWPKDPRKEGELLWPDRIGEPANAERRKKLGGHRAAGQLQQEPSAREGEILKRAYWRYYPEEYLHAVEEGDVSWLPDFRMILYSWDTAFKDKTTNDPVAGGVFGIVRGDRYLLKTRYERMSMSATKTAMLELREWGLERWPNAIHRVLIEKKSNGVEIINQLRRTVPGITPYNPGNLDKTQRAENAEPDLESGNVFICGESDAGEGQPGMDYNPMRTPAWAQEVVDQASRFPKGSHDDLVDMVTQAVNWVRNRSQSQARLYTPADVQLPDLAGVPTGIAVGLRT